jgi:hypothetical protein
MSEPKTIVLEYAAKILRYLKENPGGKHQGEITEYIQANQAYTSMALKFLISQKDVKVEARMDKSRNGSRIWRKYYSAVQDDEEVPSSSVLSR